MSDPSATLAAALTARTELAFHGYGSNDPVQAVYGEHERGLLWYCNIGRWRGQDPFVIAKGYDLPVHRLAYKMGEEAANGRGWQERAGVFFGSAIIESNNLWQRSVAELLENVTGETVARLHGKAAVYDLSALPPNVWGYHEECGALVTSPCEKPPARWVVPDHGYRWACTPAQMIGELWQRYQDKHDPPGYEWTFADHGRKVAQARWAGNRRAWISEAASRPLVREMAWRDFWANERACCTCGMRNGHA